MAFQNPVGPQPDAQRMIQSVRTFADGFTEELAKLPNIPSIAQGNAIQHTLTEILNRLDQMNTRMDQRFDDLTTRAIAR